MSQHPKSQLHDETGSPAHSSPLAGPGGNPLPTEVQPSNHRLSFAVCLFLALGVWAVFGQTLYHEFVNYDDSLYVYENRVVTQGISLKGVEWVFTHNMVFNWHPLTMISHMLDCQLYGLWAGGHHLTNVLLQAVNAMLLFLVLRNLTGALWRSAFVAAVFAVHPLRVESVAWVAERKDVLSGLFFMLTLWAYERHGRRPFSPGRYLGVIFLFAMGLLSKPMVVTLPFVLLLLDYWPLGRFAQFAGGRKWFGVPRRLLLEKIPLLVLAVVGCAVTLLAQQKAILTREQLPFALRASNALMSCTTYIGQLFYPAGLAPFYPYSTSRPPTGEVFFAALFLAAVSGGVVVWRRKRPFLMVGWLWYLGMLVPVIGLVQVSQQAHADRYTYLPQIGLSMMVVWLGADLGAGWRHRRVMLGGIMALVLAVLAADAHRQTAYWCDSESLWTHTLAVTPENYVTHDNLGVALADHGSLVEAIEHFQRALQLNPEDANAHNNLGIVLARQGKSAEAIEHYERALQFNPDYAKAHINLGIALAGRGKLAEAIGHYERALQLNPDSAEAHNNLGIALTRQDRLVEAVEHFERALQLNPDSPEAHNNLGIALARQDKLVEAAEHFERALQLNPDYANAHINLGVALARQGKLAGAIQHFQQALNLATAQGNGPLAEAIRHQLESCQTALPQPQAP
jgi:Flp pilus assembly protein TadD